MQALFLEISGIFFNKLSGNFISGFLHQQVCDNSLQETFIQRLFSLHNGHILGLIISSFSLKPDLIIERYLNKIK